MFDTLLFFHIVGVALIAGGAGVGVATGVAMARTSSVTAIGWMSALAFRAEHFAMPGAILTLVHVVHRRLLGSAVPAVRHH